MTQELGQRIRDRMHQLGMTQTQLAVRAEVSQPNISRYLSGAAEPSAVALSNIATALKTTSSALLGEPTAPIHTKFGDVYEFCARHGSELSQEQIVKLIQTLVNSQGDKSHE